jgi:hypothetical protein
MKRHRSIALYDRDDLGTWHLSPPAEVCVVCSNLRDGRLVPVSFCPRARWYEARHTERAEATYAAIRAGTRPPIDATRRRRTA